MDCGYETWKAQGSKSIKQDLTVIIFELRVDRGLISRKGRDSLAKRQGRTGTFYSRRSDLDQAAQGKGEGGGGAATPAAKTRGGAARDSPELGVPAAPGAKTTRARVGHDQRDMRDPPGAKAGLRGRSSCGYDGGVGLHGGASPACGVLVSAKA
jgi:hypothetical protein